MKKIYAFMVLCAVIFILQGCEKKDVVTDEPNNETENNSTISDGADLASGSATSSTNTDKYTGRYDTFEEGLTNNGYKYKAADASHYTAFGAVEGRKYTWDDDVVEVYRYNDNDSKLAGYKTNKRIDVDGYDDYDVDVRGNYLFVYKTKTAADKLKGLFKGFE